MSDNIVIVGTQWGDEGKGKIVDKLASSSDIVVRFQGGHNAGHTLVIGEKVFKLSLLPSGIVRENTVSIIGNGVVVNPWKLIEEIDQVKEKGVVVNSNNLIISESATIILPVNEIYDVCKESQKEKEKNDKIGTTGRGIGPAYEDKVGRRSIKMCDFFDEEELKNKISNIVKYYNGLFKINGVDSVCEKEIFNKLSSVKDKIIPHIQPVWKYLAQAKEEGKSVMFEGAQGFLLDVDHGTYPFVTSSNTVSGQAAIGSGVGPNYIDRIIGITKAYTTRVGEGPFPTELFDADGQLLGERGHEFGTVTGRERRCGWFDAVLVKQCCQISGITDIALTKLDVLDCFEKIKVCVGYDIGGKEYDYLPASKNMQAIAKPIYLEVDGWVADTFGIDNYDVLPSKAKAYIKKLEELVGVKISIISTSPERDATIIL